MKLIRQKATIFSQNMLYIKIMYQFYSMLNNQVMTLHNLSK